MVKFKDKTGKEISFEIDDVECVYSGKPNTCMCGCAGKYFYSVKNREKASERRGYHVQDEELSDKFCIRVVKKFEVFSGDIENCDDKIFTIITSPTRQYTIYLLSNG